MATENTQFMPSTPNLSSKVYADLRLKLIIGDLKPGQTLSIRTLAEAYDHGSMPVREALRQLSSEGALVGEAKKAYRVPDLSANEAAKLFYVRAALEGASAEIAAKTVEPKDIKHLRQLSTKMDGAWEVNNAGSFLENNFLFHSYIYAMAKNSVLEKMAENDKTRLCKSGEISAKHAFEERFCHVNTKRTDVKAFYPVCKNTLMWAHFCPLSD